MRARKAHGGPASVAGYPLPRATLPGRAAFRSERLVGSRATIRSFCGKTRRGFAAETLAVPGDFSKEATDFGREPPSAVSTGRASTGALSTYIAEVYARTIGARLRTQGGAPASNSASFMESHFSLDVFFLVRLTLSAAIRRGPFAAPGFGCTWGSRDGETERRLPCAE